MMKYIRTIAAGHRKGDDGASAVEYGLLVAAIAAIVVLVVFALGSYVKGAFSKTCSALSAAPGATATGSATNCNA